MSATFSDAATFTVRTGHRNEARDRAILAIARQAKDAGKLFPRRADLGHALGCSLNMADAAVMRLVREGRLRLAFSQSEKKRRLVVEYVELQDGNQDARADSPATTLQPDREKPWQGASTGRETAHGERGGP